MPIRIVLAAALTMAATAALAVPGDYYDPKVKGMWLDKCYAPGRGCGTFAARSFCKAKGWAAMKTFQVATNVAKTFIPGDGSVCLKSKGQRCDAFTFIACRKGNLEDDVGYNPM